jgi:hypothetical protein
VAEKRMLIVDVDVAQRIDENRGDLSRSEFLSLLIDNQLKEETGTVDYVSKAEFRQLAEEFHQFSLGIKGLLRNFLEFFVSFGMELGEPPKDKTFEELTEKLQALDRSGNKKK